MLCTLVLIRDTAECNCCCVNVIDVVVGLDMNEKTLVKIFLYTDDRRRGAMKDSLAFFLLNDGWNSLFGFGHRLPLLFCALLSSHAPLLPFFTFCFLTGPHILQNAKSVSHCHIFL